MWSRRKFSKAALSLQVLAGAGALNIATACAQQDDFKDGVVLAPSLQKVLKLAMDEIIPKSNEMPSASEVGGVEYILGILKENPDLIAAFEYVLTSLNIQSKQSASNNFVNLDSETRVIVLKDYERNEAEQFTVLKEFVYEGFYINEQVWKLIGYEPYPTLSAGPDMEPFDEKLLDRVKRMPLIYTDPKSS